MIPIGLIVLVVIGYAIWRGFGWGGGCCGSGHYGHYGNHDDRENARTRILKIGNLRSPLLPRN